VYFSSCCLGQCTYAFVFGTGAPEGVILLLDVVFLANKPELLDLTTRGFHHPAFQLPHTTILATTRVGIMDITEGKKNVVGGKIIVQRKIIAEISIHVTAEAITQHPIQILMELRKKKLDKID
jgi:hypothetical protein